LHLLLERAKEKSINKDKKNIPDFDSEEERAFWASADSLEYLDWDQDELVSLPKLKPSTQHKAYRLRHYAVD